MIDENKLIEKINNMSFGNGSRVASFQYFVALVLTQPQANQWIPCSERLPDEGEHVLACDTYSNIMVGWIYKDDGSNTGFTADSDDCVMYDTVAWMPLPKPYRKES